MRELHGHKVNGANEKLKIEVMDEPGQGGACHRYVISGQDHHKNPSWNDWDIEDLAASELTILFQNGPIAEVGVNGITHEAMLAILIDRFEGFQSGKYACEENAAALYHLLCAQTVLQNRTTKRLARGVEGTHEV